MCIGKNMSQHLALLNGSLKKPEMHSFLTLFYTKGTSYLMLIGSTRIVLAILQPPFGLADPIKKKVGFIK